MSNLDRFKIFQKVFEVIENMAKLASEGRFEQGRESQVNYERMKFADLISGFIGINPETFLTEKALNHRLNEIYDRRSQVRQIFPENWRVTLIALPCNGLGKEFKQSQVNDMQDDSHPYLYTMFSHPEDKLGLTFNIGGLKPAPIIKIIPEEIYQQCSIVIPKYEEVKPGEKITQQEKDIQAISTLYTGLFTNLKSVYFKQK